MTDFETKIVRFMDLFWNKKRNQCMKSWIETKYQETGVKYWCLKQETTLLQAAHGMMKEMLFAIHSDKGPEICHNALKPNDAVWDYLCHVARMEVFTFSAMSNINDGSLVRDGRGACELRLFSDRPGTKCDTSIDMAEALIHAQLAEAQRSVYHHPCIQDSMDSSTNRTIVSVRDSPDLSYKSIREAMMYQLVKTFPATGLSAMENTIKSHKYRADQEAPRTTGQFETDSFFQCIAKEYREAETEADKDQHSLDCTTMSWPQLKYNPNNDEVKAIEVKHSHPAPTNYIRFNSEISKLAMDESACLAAQIVGRNLVLQFRNKKGEEFNQCLAEMVSNPGREVTGSNMTAIENQYHIPNWATGHPVSNKEDVCLVDGI